MAILSVVGGAALAALVFVGGRCVRAAREMVAAGSDIVHGRLALHSLDAEQAQLRVSAQMQEQRNRLQQAQEQYGYQFVPTDDIGAAAGQETDGWQQQTEVDGL